jgi:hypothetical protein
VLRLGLTALLLAGAFALSAHALEPTEVRVEGVLLLEPGDPGAGAGDRVFRAALEQAVIEVAYGYLTEPVRSAPDTDARLRSSLGPRAPNFVLTFRRHGSPTARPSRTEPGRQELVLDLSATVDAAQVRSALTEIGLLQARQQRPSLVLDVRGAGPPDAPPGLFNRFQQELTQALESDHYVVVDPALHPGGGGGRGALDLARVVGADVGIDIAVSWRQEDREGQVSGVAEARVQAWRARDGSRLATLRFDAPAYHPQAEEALLRALEALEPQVATNLVLQLERNWRALEGDGTVLLQLSNVTSLRQVEDVRRTLIEALGARRADLVEIGPASAELRVSGPLSPGALQDRLSATAYDGFQLEPIEVGRSLVSVRVRPELPSDGPPDVP